MHTTTNNFSPTTATATISAKAVAASTFRTTWIAMLKMWLKLFGHDDGCSIDREQYVHTTTAITSTTTISTPTNTTTTTTTAAKIAPITKVKGIKVKISGDIEGKLELNKDTQQTF